MNCDNCGKRISFRQSYWSIEKTMRYFIIVFTRRIARFCSEQCLKEFEEKTVMIPN